MHINIILFYLQFKIEIVWLQYILTHPRIYAMGLAYKLLQHYQWPSPKINIKPWHSISRNIQMVMQQNNSGSRYTASFQFYYTPVNLQNKLHTFDDFSKAWKKDMTWFKFGVCIYSELIQILRYKVNFKEIDGTGSC